MQIYLYIPILGVYLHIGQEFDVKMIRGSELNLYSPLFENDNTHFEGT